MTAFPKLILTILTMTTLTTTQSSMKVMWLRRNMEPAWVKVTERNFALNEYKDAKGELRPRLLIFSYFAK